MRCTFGKLNSGSRTYVCHPVVRDYPSAIPKIALDLKRIHFQFLSFNRIFPLIHFPFIRRSPYYFHRLLGLPVFNFLLQCIMFFVPSNYIFSVINGSL